MRGEPARLTRRCVLASAGAGIVAGRVVPAAGAAQTSRPAGKPVPCLFSKALQNRPAEALPGMLTELGVRAVDLTVRPGGHVLPERAADDLPAACERLASAGIDVPMITTAITDADRDHAETIVATAGKLGIRHAKIGYYTYRDPGGIGATLADVRSRLRGVAALFRQHGVTAGFHNHSGNFVGAAMWDVWELIRDLDAGAVGSYFDVGHATAEGAAGGWRVGMSLLMPRITIVGIKDVCFRKDEKGAWRTVWGPLGEGMVRIDEALRRLKDRGFAGPISLHVEYGPYTSPAGSEDDRRNLQFVRQDLAFLREAMQRAKLA